MWACVLYCDSVFGSSEETATHLSSRPSEPASGLDSYFESACATSLMVSCQHDPESTQNSWLSLLAVPGTLLYNTSLGLASLGCVLDTNRRGVILWNIRPVVAGGQRKLAFDPPVGVDKWRYEHIVKLDDWCCQETENLPPCLCKELLADGTPRGLTIAIPKPTGMAILKHSAMHAFPKLTVPYLKKLVSFLEVPCAHMPQVEVELLTLLLNYLLPTLTGPERAEILAKRTLKSKIKFDSILTVAGIEDVIAQCADHDDVDAAVAEAKKYAHAVEGIKAAAFAKAKAKAKGAAVKKKKKLAAKDTASVEEARKYLPPRDGCQLYMESEWHLRWKVTYTTVLLPSTTSACFEEGCDESKRNALTHCLRWAWAEHERYSGEACPWDL